MNKLDKKLRKLMRDPKLFFTDMYKKRKNQIKNTIPLKLKEFINILLYQQYIMLKNTLMNFFLA